MDFHGFAVKETKKGLEIRPSFRVARHKDIMSQGKTFYAVWDEEAGLWSRDEFDVVRLVDAELAKKVAELEATGETVIPMPLGNFDNGGWLKFQSLMKNMSDNSHPLDSKVVFSDTPVKRSDYVSRRLPYKMGPGSIAAYEELVSHLYDPEERQKFEWAIGAVLTGAAKTIQKFVVFYGDPGTGKSTVMDIAFKLLGGLVKDGGYCATFEAKALVGQNNAFATEAFKDNPLLAIQHDGDLSRIEDNTKLNSIVSHEDMRVNEKYKATYDSKVNAMLFMGTNSSVMISNAKSGILRRLLDVYPSLRLHQVDRYNELIALVDFELGAIAHHCIEVYKKLGRAHYNGYRSERMLENTNPFYNFIQHHWEEFHDADGCSYTRGWALWKEYKEDAQIEWKLPKHRFKDEFRNYWEEFHDRITIDGVSVRSYFTGFKDQKFKAPVQLPNVQGPVYSLALEETVSIFDEMYAGLPGQYSKRGAESPAKYWDDGERLIGGELKRPEPDQICSTTLGDLDTSRIHFVKVPVNHIVIDFDLVGEDGEKSLELNLLEAAKWPQTYAEVSKSGKGVHLHYWYDGDTDQLANVFSEGIEVKVYRGGASLRRKLTKCNNLPVATISSGLPFREKKMIDLRQVRNEQGIRSMLLRCLQKEFHAGTKPNVDFMERILLDAYESGVQYNVEDMRGKIISFAGMSTNQAVEALRTVKRMKWASDDSVEKVTPEVAPRDNRLAFFDIEVYPNLVLICWSFEGEDEVHSILNPTPQQVEWLFALRLVGFYNRDYDNHILWAIFIGETIPEIYARSQKLVSKDRKIKRSAQFGEAFNLSYADSHDMNTDKQSLKKWEIQLGIPHMEMDIPWDQPVPEDRILDVIKYCSNDVKALKDVFKHNEADYISRMLLAKLSGRRVNDPTRAHVTRILFNGDKNPQKQFVYTDLSEQFQGYKFDPYAPKDQKSTYRGMNPSEGGFVYAEPGVYEDVWLFDVASMHPSSLRELNYFGPYTKKFCDILDARLAIKNGDYEGAKRILPALEIPRNKVEAKHLEKALKLVINSIYGYTAATFESEFYDKRNVDNIIAKRGALFMIDMLLALQERGVKVVHIKTDSIKVVAPTKDDIQFIMEFGWKYGYSFEHEATYRKFALVNDAVYIARCCWNKDEQEVDYWTATGAQFKEPVVFKSLFSNEEPTFKDYCQTKSVREGAIYLKNYGGRKKENGDPLLQFVGKVGQFLPVVENGAELMRVITKDDGEMVDYAIGGTKGYQWMEASVVEHLIGGDMEKIFDVVDQSYYAEMIEKARDAIEKFGSFNEFVSG